MPVVTKEQLKIWFSNFKKPPEGEFWAWLDSFRHILDKVPLDDVDGLKVVLSKKADLIDGVVPEDQLPFSVVTSEVITLGLVEQIGNKIYLRVHSSGANKVRVKGKLITRTFQNQWTITPIVADGVKVLRGYAVKNNVDFLLAEGAELPTYVEPEIPEDALEIFKITMRSSGNVIEQTETGLKYIAEDGWRNILLTEELTVLPYNFDLKSSYWINSRVANPVIGGIHNGVIDRNASPTWDGKEFWLFNNTGGDLLLDPSNVTAIDVYLFSDKLMPLTIKKSNAVLLKLKDNVIEIMQGGGGGASFPVSGNDGDVLVKSGTSALWSSIIKGVEFLGNAWLKLKLISFQGYTIAQKNAIASPTEGMLIYQNENPKGFQKYEGGTWSAIGSNISNADLSNVSARTFTQGNAFTWNTAGHFHYLKGLLDKTGNGAYTKALIIHPTTGERVTRDFADPAATTLAVQNASAAQKTSMRTALLGTAVPASPIINVVNTYYIKRNTFTMLILSGVNLVPLDPTAIWIQNGAQRVDASSYFSLSATSLQTFWTIPNDFPLGEYLVNLSFGVVAQGANIGKLVVVDEATTLNYDFNSSNVNILFRSGYAVTPNQFYVVGTNSFKLNKRPINSPIDSNVDAVLKTGNIFLGALSSSWEIIIEVTFLDTNGSGSPNAPFIVLSETTDANFTDVNSIFINYTLVWEGVIGSLLRMRDQNGQITSGINLITAITTATMVIRKSGNTLTTYIFSPVNGNVSAFVSTAIDTSKNYALAFTQSSLTGFALRRDIKVTASIYNQ